MLKRSTTVLLACFCTVFAAYAIRYSYGTLLPAMLTSLQISKAQAGVIYSSYFVAYTLFSPVMGILSDRWDMRIIISVFVVLMGAGAFLMQYSHSVWQASLYFSLAGTGCAACWAPVMAVAQRWANPKRRGLTLALVDAGSTLGVMVAGFLVPLAVSASSWRMGWLGLGMFGLALGAVDLFAIRNSPLSDHRKLGSTSVTGSKKPFGYRVLFSNNRFWLIAMAYLMTGFAVMVPFTFISTYSSQERGLTYSASAALVTVIGAGGLTGKLVLGPLSDRLGRIKVMLICSALIATGCLGLALCSGSLLFIMAVVFGAGYGACWSLYAAFAADYFNLQSAGGIIGIWTFYLGIGLLASPIVAGWIGDIRGSLFGSFVLAAAAGALSLLLLLPLLREDRRV
jgi:MFS family permease